MRPYRVRDHRALQSPCRAILALWGQAPMLGCLVQPFSWLQHHGRGPLRCWAPASRCDSGAARALPSLVRWSCFRLQDAEGLGATVADWRVACAPDHDCL